MNHSPGTHIIGLLASCLLLTSLLLSRAAAQKPVTAGMKLSAGAKLRPGKYHLADPGGGTIQVTGANFTVDFKGVQLIGPGNRTGVGLRILDARNVTIKNATISGWLWGLQVDRSVGVRLENCTVSYNSDLPSGTVIDESGKEPEDQWGGGILLRDSQNCFVERCRSMYQWDGIDVISCTGCIIRNGDFSYNGNWGIHLWNSSQNQFVNNRAIWCTTGSGKLFQALTGWQTYDSQAVGIDHNSNENLIEGNDLRFGGDGIFIRANEGPITPGTAVPPRNGSHRNILRNNDCSFSPNNAIEVDLVDDTIIEGNNCSYSNYGMWLGYSRRCKVRNNVVLNCTNHAVEIENGQDDLFENNLFGWDAAKPDGVLIYLRKNDRDATRSGGYKLRHNTFFGAGTAILLKQTAAEIDKNILLNSKASVMKLVSADTGSEVNDRSNPSQIFTTEPAGKKEWLLRAGKALGFGSKETMVRLNGIPLMLGTDKPKVRLPLDFWDRPYPETVMVERLIANRKFRESGRMIWPPGLPRITGISPNPARLGDIITVTGANLEGGRLIMNGVPVNALTSTPTLWKVETPPNILSQTRYNVMWERGEGIDRVHTTPITFAIDVPVEQRPHLISVEFSPTTLHVGERLKVTMTVKNNLPHSALTLQLSDYPLTYQEHEGYWDRNIQDKPGLLHLRVTSSNPKGNNPGSWPWLFGFNGQQIPAHETATVVGYIQLETPGEIEFRTGLVASGSRFIDDNMFRTKITVLPAAK